MSPVLFSSVSRQRTPSGPRVGPPCLRTAQVEQSMVDVEDTMGMKGQIGGRRSGTGGRAFYQGSCIRLRAPKKRRGTEAAVPTARKQAALSSMEELLSTRRRMGGGGGGDTEDTAARGVSLQGNCWFLFFPSHFPVFGDKSPLVQLWGLSSYWEA